MATPSSKQIQEAYDTIARAEKTAISGIKRKGEEFLSSLDEAVNLLPGGRMPQTAGLANLSSWRSQVQVIIQNLDVLVSQYGGDDEEAPKPGA